MLNLDVRQRVVTAATVLVLASCGVLAASAQPPAPANQTTHAGEWILALTPGQVIRVIGVSNPWARRTPNPALISYAVLAAYGQVLFESKPMEVHHGAMVFSDVAHRVLNSQGEPGTGRLQVRVAYWVHAPAGTKSADLSVLAEVFDEATGRTVVRTGPISDVLYSAIH